MTLVHHVLPAEPCTDLASYQAAGGGRGLDAARRLGPAATIDEIEAAGLRGRGGAGFPTGTKWRTVADNASSDAPATVVVNAAEGEPGTFKDRAILRSNPFAVLEGGLIAALAVGADELVVAMKDTFTHERAVVEAAIEEVRAAGWADGVAMGVATGPQEYLFGEETALLEVLDGRPPFPRIAPPYRHGVDEVGVEPDEPAGTVMAVPGREGAAPTLVNNTETIANVARILADGPAAFRALGTEESPGTVVVTVTGATVRHGVGEVAMGTPLAEAIELIGGGARRNHRLVAALSGVANPVIPAEHLDVPLTYEAMTALGTGLGAAGFIVFDDETDLAAVAAGVSRFLAIESCGQCTPCKQDGLAIADHLARVCGAEGADIDVVGATERLTTVAEGARCYLAHQHEGVVGSLLRLFPDAFTGHVEGRIAPVEPAPVAPIVDIVDGLAVLDDTQAAKQPDWTRDGGPTSGKSPVDRLAESSD